MPRFVRTQRDHKQQERVANTRHNEVKRLERELRAAWRGQQRKKNK